MKTEDPAPLPEHKAGRCSNCKSIPEELIEPEYAKQLREERNNWEERE